MDKLKVWKVSYFFMGDQVETVVVAETLNDGIDMLFKGNLEDVTLDDYEEINKAGVILKKHHG